jgi:hypothetical protein
MTDGRTKQTKPWDDKVRALRAHRRARGECFTCGDKFQPGHKYTKTVPLNVVEEFLAAMQYDGSATDHDKDGSSEKEPLMHISPCAMAGVQSSKSMRPQRVCQGKQVLLLIDSGSAHSIISSSVVKQLDLATVDIAPVIVTVADGDALE